MDLICKSDSVCMNVYVLFVSSPLSGGKKFIKIFSDTAKGLECLRKLQKQRGGKLSEDSLLLDIPDENAPETHVGISYNETWWLEVHTIN